MSEEKKQKIKVCCVASVDITLKFMLFNQLKFLQEQGYDVSAVCSEGKWVKDIEAEGIKVKTIRFKRRSFSPRSDLSAFFQLFFYLKYLYGSRPKINVLSLISIGRSFCLNGKKE